MRRVAQILLVASLLVAAGGVWLITAGCREGWLVLSSVCFDLALIGYIFSNASELQ